MKSNFAGSGSNQSISELNEQTQQAENTAAAASEARRKSPSPINTTNNNNNHQIHPHHQPQNSIISFIEPTPHEPVADAVVEQQREVKNNYKNKKTGDKNSQQLGPLPKQLQLQQQQQDCPCEEGSPDEKDDTKHKPQEVKLIIGPHYLLGEQRFIYLVPSLALIDVLFCIIGSFGIDAIYQAPVAPLEAVPFFALLGYVFFADVLAVSACSKPTIMRTSVSIVCLVPKLFFVFVDASTFLVMSVWLSILMIVLIATVRRGISWEIVEVTCQRKRVE